MISWDDIQNNWAIVAGFVGGLVAWGETRSTAKGARESVTKAHERISDSEKQIAELRECTARMGAHYEHTMKAVDEIKREIRNRGPQP